jgi:xylulokinase
MKLVVGVDSSTQSCKVEIREQEKGLLISTGVSRHEPTFPPKSEQDPNQWWQAFVLAFQNATADDSVDKNLIEAIAVTAQCHGMVTLDDEFNIVRPAKLWNDTQSAPQSNYLVEKYGQDYWINQIGSLIGPSFTLTKILWLKENEPENFKKVKKICLPHDFLTARLSNRLVTDRAGATCTGYYSVKDSRWTYEILDTIDSTKNWSETLPEILGPETIASKISENVAKELGIRSSVVVGPGTGDQMASCMGLGTREGDFVFSIGTSAVIFTVSNKPVYDLTGIVNGMADSSGKYMPVMVGLNGTKITDWAAKIMDCSLEELGELALSAELDENSAVMAAFFDGERTPNLPYATGVIAGLNSMTDRKKFARCIFDGVLLPLIKNYNFLKNLVQKSDGRIIFTGGASRSKAYQQILADLLQEEIYIVDVEESSARGACVQATAIARGTTASQIIEQWQPKVVKIVSPRKTLDLTDYFLKYDACASWREMDRND